MFFFDADILSYFRMFPLKEPRSYHRVDLGRCDRDILYGVDPDSITMTTTPLSYFTVTVPTSSTTVPPLTTREVSKPILWIRHDLIFRNSQGFRSLYKNVCVTGVVGYL